MYLSAVLSVLILVILPVVCNIFLEVNYYYNLETLRDTPYHIYLGISQSTVVAFLIAYALYPFLLSSNRYFNRQNFGSLVVEYDLLKRIISSMISLLLLAMLLFFIAFGQNSPEDSGCYKQNIEEQKLDFEPSRPVCYLYTITPALTLIVTASIVRFFSNISKRDFRYYYARGCFQISKNQSESAKMTYLIRAINSYNKFLKRNLKLQINDTNEVSSKIISDSVLEHYDLTSSISDAFFSDNKLKPVEYMLNLLNIRKTEKFLVKEATLNKIKESGAFFVAIIPVIISIIKLYLDAVATLAPS